MSECGNLCSSCTQTANGATTCDICSPGATLSSGKCVNCPQNCAQCSVTDLGSCTSCLPGYFYAASQQICKACSMSNCLTCTDLACQVCRSGYIISPSLTCQRECLLPCSTCSETDPSQCLKCVTGFTFNTNANQNCEPNLGCNNNGSCSNCPIGFSMRVNNNFATCQQCNSICARCNPNAGNTCLSCFDGSYLDGTSCASCPSSCAKCTSATACYQCADGFIAEQAASQQTSQQSASVATAASVAPVNCLACAGNCLTCINSPTTCLSCRDNFRKSGNKCLNLNKIELSVTFTPSNNDFSFFNNNYDTIMSGLASAAGVPQSDIIVKEIIYSSVVLNADVTTTAVAGSDQATNIQSSIDSYFKDLSITNLAVAQATIVNPGTPPPTEDSSNSTLIIAIVVPIVIVRTYLVI